MIGLRFACSEPYLSPAISDSVHLEISEIAKRAFSDEGRSKAAMCTSGNPEVFHNALPGAGTADMVYNLCLETLRCSNMMYTTCSATLNLPCNWSRMSHVVRN
jgi:hypothetical protein